jgi:hypothetical protein
MSDDDFIPDPPDALGEGNLSNGNVVKFPASEGEGEKKKRFRPERGQSLAETIDEGPYADKGQALDALIQWQRLNERREAAGLDPVQLKRLSEWIKMPLAELRNLERSTEFTTLLLRDAKKRGVRSVVKMQPLIEKILREKASSPDSKIQKEFLQEQREYLTLLGIKEVDSAPVIEGETDTQKLIDETLTLIEELGGKAPNPFRFISTMLERGSGASREQSEAGKRLSEENAQDRGEHQRDQAHPGD